MSHIVRRRSLAVFAFLICAGVLLGVLPPALTEAGSNGQQLQFTCQNMTYGAVEGKNNAGKYVRWEGRPQPGNSAMRSYYVTKGWYWVGTVRAYWYYNGKWKSKQVSVPKKQSGNITYASC